MRLGDTKRQGSTRRPLLSLVLALSFFALTSLAHGETYYLNKREFYIPYALDQQSSFKQLRLHVSTNGRDFSEAATTDKSKGKFDYTAQADGTYTFVVQVEDAAGQLTPANVQQATPTVRIIVDTEKPKLSLRAVQAQGGRAAVEWRIEDQNPDLRTLKLESRLSSESTWIPHSVKPIQHAQYTWDPPGEGTYEVRLTVRDLAGNEATATTQVYPSASGGTGTPAPANDNVEVIYVKQKRFKLTYKIADAGPSSVKHVEVWMTRDRGQWQRTANASATGPHEITVPNTGRYGFSLRPVSGVGRARPAPRGGESPQIWVEVDETKPEVQIQNVALGEGTDKEKVIITYRATDAFLKENPIRLLYRKTASEEWQKLGESEFLDNSGIAKITPPQGVFEFFVRVEAIDKAGNIGFADSKETVKADPSEPRVEGVGVEKDTAQNSESKKVQSQKITVEVEGQARPTASGPSP